MTADTSCHWLRRSTYRRSGEVIQAYPVPPNPSELMAGDKMADFKKYLDEHYDVVVIDTPPYGIVADAQLMQNWANICLVVTRFRMTIREQVHEIEEWNRTKLFKNVALIFNGIHRVFNFGEGQRRAIVLLIKVEAAPQGRQHAEREHISIEWDLGIRDAEIRAHADFRKTIYDYDVLPHAEAAAMALA